MNVQQIESREMKSKGPYSQKSVEERQMEERQLEAPSTTDTSSFEIDSSPYRLERKRCSETQGKSHHSKAQQCTAT